MIHDCRDLVVSVCKRISRNALSWLFALLMLVAFSAGLWSLLEPLLAGRSTETKVQISESVATNPRHTKIASALARVSGGLPFDTINVKLFIAQSPDINAASFGNGRFLFWDGTADLPEDILEAIAAHEVAHDVLRHARKANELKDLTDFFGELVGLVTQSDDSTENTLKHWFGSAVLPKYSRTQELEADAKAVEILRLCGYNNPRKTMSDCLETLLSRYGNSGGAFFDSHPSTRERIKRLNAEGSGKGMK